MRATSFFLALSATLSDGAAHAAEATPSQVSFNHKDWEIACDNTRTCRAAGYQTEALGPSASVLLTRQAGPNEPVLAELGLAETGDERDQPSTVNMFIDGKALGKVMLHAGPHPMKLSAEQTAALLTALKQNAVIEWRAGKARWSISTAGSNAVLLKMDEFQGRLGTPGALVRKGDKPEASVLPPLPRPVVQAVKPKPSTAETKLSAGEQSALTAALRKATGDDVCEKLHEDMPGVPRELNAYLLTDQQMLVRTNCWLGAYNTGDGFWLVNRRPPYAPRFVTDEANDYDDGEMTGYQKGRGIADCVSNKTWTWDGKNFILTSAMTTGMCRGFAIGGAWEFPTLVSEVKPPR